MLPSKIGWNFTEQTRLGFIFDDMRYEHCIVAIFFHSDNKKQNKTKQKTLSCDLLLLPFAHNSLKIGLSQHGR